MTIEVLHGDCRDVLATLPAASVQCCVTSPPYFGLRDYGEPDQIGAEADPAAYVAALVEVFRAVRSVLRPDGTVWLNLGDSYATHAAGKVDNPMAKSTLAGVRTQEVANRDSRASGRYLKVESLPEKNLLGIPWRVAFALQADGWWLRSAIVWAKPNPMPESVTDRPTSSYEMVFLLTKAATYYYDADAIAEPATYAGEQLGICRGTKRRAYAMGCAPSGNEVLGADADIGSTRNARNVWTIATSPSSIGHFALMPPALAERCIRAGTSERGCCAACGAPWGRVVERESRAPDYRSANKPIRYLSASAAGQGSNGTGGSTLGMVTDTTTTGWSPSCTCDADVVPCTVLDPFSGAGTTGLVADRLGRDAVLIDLSAAYTDTAAGRIVADCPLFAEVTMAVAAD